MVIGVCRRWMSAMLSSVLGRLPGNGHDPPDWRRAHRAHPLTSTPEHCALPAAARTIERRMDQSAVALPDALLEREHEVERVSAAVREVGQRSGRALIISGAAGIGKSRLLEEARLQAPDLGIRVLSARATELEQGFPFGIVRQLFERPLLEADLGERERWLAGAAALAADVLTGAPGSMPTAHAPSPSAGASDYAWRHGLYWLASNISADSPLVLVVDDMQWCDAPSALALAFIARRLEG